MYKREKGTLILFTFMTLKTVFKIKDSWIKLVLREERKGEQESKNRMCPYFLQNLKLKINAKMKDLTPKFFYRLVSIPYR